MNDDVDNITRKNMMKLRFIKHVLNMMKLKFIEHVLRAFSINRITYAHDWTMLYLWTTWKSNVVV
jgi:hypothetical protein